MDQGMASAVDVILGRKSAADVATEQAQAFLAGPAAIKVVIGMGGALVLAGALMWIGAQLAKGAWGLVSK